MRKFGQLQMLSAILLLSVIFLFAGCSGGVEGVGDLGSVAGIVTDAVTENPLEGVAITVGEKSATTDSQGRYLILSVKQGNYTLTGSLEGYDNYSKEITVQGEQTTVVSFEMTPAGPETGTVTGVVIVAQPLLEDAVRALQPVEGVEVTVGDVTGLTNQQGEYTLEGVLPGTGLDITATREGFEGYEGTVDVTAGETTTYDFSMNPIFYQVNGGWYHSAGLKGDGTVWTWGRNTYGELGNGDDEYNDSNVPVQVVGPEGEGFLTDIISVYARDEYTLALRADGTVWGWGVNYNGQLGNGTYDDSNVPVQVAGPEGEGFLTDVVAIATGYEFAGALRADGTVWTWGDNDYGQLGNGDDEYNDSNVPVQVVAPGTVPTSQGATRSEFLTDIVAIAIGDEFAVALKSDGTVWTWGYNAYGQLGNDDEDVDDSPVPVQVVGHAGEGFLTGITEVKAGWYHAAVLDSNGAVWTWGENLYGQLGNGDDNYEDSYSPVQVLAPGEDGFLTGLKAMDTRGRHTIVIRADDSIWAWGYNEYGQLGNGDDNYENSNIPVRVVGPGGVGFLADIIKVSGGGNHSFAIGTDGTVWAWGRNSNGQLGNGDDGTDENTPVQVVGTPHPWSEITAVTRGVNNVRPAGKPDQGKKPRK